MTIYSIKCRFENHRYLNYLDGASIANQYNYDMLSQYYNKNNKLNTTIHCGGSFYDI